MLCVSSRAVFNQITNLVSVIPRNLSLIPRLRYEGHYELFKPCTQQSANEWHFWDKSRRGQHMAWALAMCCCCVLLDPGHQDEKYRISSMWA
jgi:hypothetical protein